MRHMKGDSPGGCWPDAASCGGANRGRLWWYWMNTGCVSAMCCAMARPTLPMSGSNEWWDVGSLVPRSAPSSLAALSLSDVCRLHSPDTAFEEVPPDQSREVPSKSFGRSAPHSVPPARTFGGRAPRGEGRPPVRDLGCSRSIKPPRFLLRARLAEAGAVPRTEQHLGDRKRVV